MLSGGHSRVLNVTIPPIASEVAISVNKGNPGIRVNSQAPDGAPVTGGSLGGSTFERSGQDTAVEVLHISNPQAGVWKIRLTAPKDLRNQLVSAIAFWQGTVRVAILASPPTARPGQRINVTLSVLGTKGPITDPALLRGMHVQVNVTGDGLSGPLTVPVNRATGISDSGLTAGDYVGTFTAPSTPGRLTFTGTAEGYGLYATEVPTQVSVNSIAGRFQGTIQFSGAPVTVFPGQAIQGQVLFNNQTGQSRRVRLVLSAIPVLATITAPQRELTVPSGTSTDHFTIALSQQTPVGPASLIVRVVERQSPSHLLWQSAAACHRDQPAWPAREIPLGDYRRCPASAPLCSRTLSPEAHPAKPD